MATATTERILTLNAEDFTTNVGRGAVAVKHSLAGHPLFRLEAVAELADRFPGRVEYHSADLPQVVPDGTRELYGPRSETVLGIEDNGYWMVFWNIEQLPEYEDVLVRCVGEAEPLLPAEHRGPRQLEAFLFLSAPNAMTPIHFDPEHNFLLQIQGQKDFHVCPFESREDKFREVRRYYGGGHRNLGALPCQGTRFALDPGDGLYVPPFMPHLVQNGPSASISLSVTFRTEASLRAERVFAINERLQRLGLAPRPPGESQARDHLKESLWIAFKQRSSYRARFSRIRRKPRHDAPGR